MEDNEKKTIEKKSISLSEASSRIQRADDSEDHEKKKPEADQLDPSLGSQRMRMAPASSAPEKGIEFDIVILPEAKEAGISNPPRMAGRATLRGSFGKEAGTNDPSQTMGLGRLRMESNNKSTSPGNWSFLDSMNAAIQRAPTVPTLEEHTKKIHEELSTYLSNDFNLELHTMISAKEGSGFSLGESRGFFKELYQQYSFVKENKANPALVLSRIRQIERNYLGRPNYFPSDDQAAKRELEGKVKIRVRRILSSLAMLIRNENEVDGDIQDGDLRRCLKLIEQELENHLQDSSTRAQVMTEVRSVMLKRKFDFAKVKNHIKSLQDIEAKYQYLIEILLEYDQQDLVDEDMSQGFGKKCQLEIDELEKRMALERPSQGQVEEQPEIQADNQEEYSWRSRILALLLLTFGRLDVPEDVQKTKVLEFFLFITGGKNRQKIKELPANPTKVKTGSERSIKPLCADLNSIRDHFSRLGMSQPVRQAIAEIEFLLDDLEKESD